MVYPLDTLGLPDRSQPPFKPKIERCMLHNIRGAAPTFGKIVGKGKYAATIVLVLACATPIASTGGGYSGASRALAFNAGPVWAATLG